MLAVGGEGEIEAGAEVAGVDGAARQFLAVEHDDVFIALLGHVGPVRTVLGEDDGDGHVAPHISRAVLVAGDVEDQVVNLRPGHAVHDDLIMAALGGKDREVIALGTAGAAEKLAVGSQWLLVNGRVRQRDAGGAEQTEERNGQRI